MAAIAAPLAPRRLQEVGLSFVDAPAASSDPPARPWDPVGPLGHGDKALSGIWGAYALGRK